MDFPFGKPVSVVLNYRPDGFFAVPADLVYHADGDWRKLPPDSIRPLEVALAEEFLYCRLGVEDVFYDSDSKTLYYPSWVSPHKNMTYRHVITTKVIEVKLSWSASDSRKKGYRTSIWSDCKSMKIDFSLFNISL